MNRCTTIIIKDERGKDHGIFSGVFDSDKLADAINTTKNATKNITGKVAGSFAESAGEMKKFSEETKKMKQPVEGSNHALRCRL